MDKVTEYQKGLVSIIIPTKGDRDIGPTLESVRKQSFRNYEIIQIQDKEHRGAPWARNKGEKQAKGDFILFLDDDIVLDREYLAKMMKALASNPKAAYAYCHYRRKGKFDDVYKSLPFDGEFLRRNHNFISTMSLMRHADFVPWDEKLKRLQDWDMWLTLLEKGKKGIFIDEILFTANYRGDGITKTDYWYIRNTIDIVRVKHGMVGQVLKERTKDVLRPVYRKARKLKIVPDLTRKK